MNTTTLLLRAAALAFGAAVAAAPAIAQTAAPTAATAPAAADLTDGEVRKVDKDARKLTIRHAEIKNLDMPAMTMVFQVADPALLDKLKPGDKIRFAAQKVDGAYVVMAVQMAR